jgi:NAD(P)-dependent dehydrogenase (short-subunit alcohol dehydrogenase family)
MAKFGRLDGAFNNAGVSGSTLTKLADISFENWDATLAVNLTSIFTCMKYEIKAMLDSGGGVIVNNSSIYGMRGSYVGTADYVATKHAVLGLTKTAALDYAKAGIRINAVCPGYTHSEMVDPIIAADPQGFDSIITARIPMGRIAETDEITNGVVWLLSQESTFMTGQALVLDGGWTAF